MSKSAADGYDMSKIYAEKMLKNNGGKLVQALAAVKLDIDKRRSFSFPFLVTLT